VCKANYAAYVKVIMPSVPAFGSDASRKGSYKRGHVGALRQNGLDTEGRNGIIGLTPYRGLALLTHFRQFLRLCEDAI